MCAALASFNLRNKGNKGNNKIAPLEPKYGAASSFLQSKFDSWNSVLLQVNNRLTVPPQGVPNDKIEEDSKSNLTKDEENEKSKWTPREEKPTKELLACAVAILVIFFMVVIFGFIVVIGGYELFCFTFLETKAFRNALNATNATCPNNPDQLAIPIES